MKLFATLFLILSGLSLSLFCNAQVSDSTLKENEKVVLISATYFKSTCATKMIRLSKSEISVDSCYDAKKNIFTTDKKIGDKTSYSLVFDKSVEDWKKIERSINEHAKKRHCDQLLPDYKITVISGGKKYNFVLANAPNCYPENAKDVMSTFEQLLH